MAIFDLITNHGTFSNPDDWLNESTSGPGVPGPSDTADTNGFDLTGSGSVGTIDGGLIMDALALTAATVMDAGIQVTNNSSLTVTGAFSLTSSDNIDVSDGEMTTDGAVTGDVTAITGGIEVDSTGIWIANATVSGSRIESSGNLNAGVLSDISSLQIGGGMATAGAVSVQQYVDIQSGQVTLGNVSILGVPPNSLPAFEVSDQATVTTGTIIGNSSLTPGGTGNLEVLGSGTSLLVQGDVSMLSGLIAGTSSDTSITGNLEENELSIGGYDTSDIHTMVGVVGDVDIGVGNSPVATISEVTQGGELSLGGVLTIGADASWDSTLEVNNASAETGDFGATTLFPGIVLAASIDVGGAGIGTLDIEDGGGVNATGTVMIGNGDQPDDAAIVNGVSSELSGGDVMISDATVTVENGGELASTAGDGGVDVVNTGDISLAGGTINSPVLIDIESLSNIVGYGTLQGVVDNDGAVVASGGTLALTNSAHGTGAFVIDAQSALDLEAGSVSSGLEIDFDVATGPPGTLIVPDTSLSPTIKYFVPGDLIDVQGADITGFDYSQLNANTGFLTIIESNTPERYFEFFGSYTTEQFQHSVSPDGTYISVTAAQCYAAGTRILTEHGEVEVENLVVGDRVITRFSTDGARIVWLGHRRVDCDRHKRPRDVWPVRVQAGAFGPDRPHRDLLLSPNHAVFVNGVLIPIRLLANGDTIAPEQVAEITYWHVELAEHDVILAEGLEAESYLDIGNRSAFDNHDGLVVAHPLFASSDVWETESCAPLVMTGPALDAVRRELRARADDRAMIA